MREENNDKKNGAKMGHLLRHNEFIIIIMEEKINGKRTRERPRKSFFEDIFYRMCFTIFQQLKGRHVTDTNGYNDKVCSLEADDDDVSVFIIIYTLSSCKNNLFYDGLE